MGTNAHSNVFDIRMTNILTLKTIIGIRILIRMFHIVNIHDIRHSGIRMPQMSNEENIRIYLLKVLICIYLTISEKEHKVSTKHQSQNQQKHLQHQPHHQPHSQSTPKPQGQPPLPFQPVCPNSV